MPVRPPAAADPAAPHPDIRRELYLLTLYRILEAALLCLALFSPVGSMIGEPRHLGLGRVLAVLYLIAAIGLFLSGRGGRIRTQALVGVAVDVLAATLAMHALPESAAGIAMMLLFNIGAAAFLLPLRLGIGCAVLGGTCPSVGW